MRLIGLLLIIFQLSCTIDELPSCEGLGVEGEICKEYQSVFGRYNGVNEYDYDLYTGFLSKITTKSKNGSIQRFTKYSYDDLGLVSSIVFEDSKGRLFKDKKFYYNDFGDVETEITLGNIKTEHNYYYDEDVLTLEVFSSDGKVEWTDSLEYFSGTNELYRKLRFVANTLIQITYYESFTNNVKEERVTNNNGVTQSKKVTHFNESKEKLEELTYSKANILLNRVAFFYFGGELDRIEKYNEIGEKYEELNYQRY